MAMAVLVTTELLLGSSGFHCTVMLLPVTFLNSITNGLKIYKEVAVYLPYYQKFIINSSRVNNILLWLLCIAT